ncbi:MAG: lipocalin family protein [Opitutaceae bacterium]|nr:lipocalin family protein [Verrucomicrobiales bacterium]
MNNIFSSQSFLVIACLAGLCPLLLMTGCATSGGAQTKSPLRTVDHVDLDRYMGDWFVIANIPSLSAEKGVVGSVERYARRTDGDIDNVFEAYADSFLGKKIRYKARAWVVDKKSNAEWKVQFFWPIRFAYLTIDLDPGYQWTVVGHPSRDYLWIMSRSKTLDEATYQGIVKRCADQGYDVSRIRKVPQTEVQVGEYLKLQGPVK